MQKQDEDVNLNPVNHMTIPDRKPTRYHISALSRWYTLTRPVKYMTNPKP